MDDNELNDDFSEYIDYRNVESIEVIFGTTTSSQQRYLLSPSFVYIKLIDDDVHSIAVYFTTLEIPTRIGDLGIRLYLPRHPILKSLLITIPIDYCLLTIAPQTLRVYLPPEIKKEKVVADEKIGQKRVNKEKLSRGTISSEDSEDINESENGETILEGKKQVMGGGKTKTVGVTEVMDEDFLKGIAPQNAVQFESALSNRKRKASEIEERIFCGKIFRIITGAKEWYFIECSLDDQDSSYQKPIAVVYDSKE
ncbi:hypothetical protein RhiirA5_414865 [Rhizophagus irregularis]|uniref:Uncharacterized protein n=1 Tax=Rhizophagus irregularis TaxID=588596 RepID=A0A2N0PT78_9GLOM|nr:hypothetical protein RhiirA5_414865 [Rhizophagus irregularis]